MPISGSAYASALKSIGFPKTASEAQQKWEQAWKDMVSGCTQAATTGLAYSLSGIFEPTDSKTKFADKLESAGKADIAAFILQPQYGTTTPPTSPLGWSPATADSVASPAGDLGDKYATFVKSAMYTGIPPTPVPGPLS